MTRHRRAPLVVALVGFLTAGLYLLRHYRYPTLDLLNYVSIARRYASGDLAGAINACWGPLESWLLVPLLWAGVDPILGYRLIAIGLGAVGLVGVWCLSHRFEMGETLRSLVILVAAAWMLSFYYVPDLLIVCLLVYYLYFLLDPRLGDRPSRVVLCGLVGGLAYLSKGYALPFFLLHFTLFAAIRWLRGDDRRAVMRDYLIGVLAFAILAAPWVALLSQKYGGFMINSGSAYTYAVLGPDSPGHPVFGGFLEPHDSTALSAMEDPTLLDVESWSPFESWRNLRHQLRMSLTNLAHLLAIYSLFSPLWLSVLVGCALLSMPWRDHLSDPVLLSLVTILVYPAGYLITQLTESGSELVLTPHLGRYVWINAILMLILGACCLDQVFRSSFFDRRRRVLLGTVFGLAFLAFPLVAIGASFRQDLRVHEIADQMAAESLGGRIASNSRQHRSRYLTYRLGGQFYGAQPAGHSAAALEADLDRLGIDYFVYWVGSQGDPEPPPFLRRRPDVSEGRYPELRVFDLRPSR